MKQTVQKKLTSLSCFMPAYNEAGNIREAMIQALRILPQVAKEYELIIINDGSQDNTLQIAKAVAEQFPSQQIRVINQRNRGYGGALKRGFAVAKYDWVFFTDADLQFDMSELPKLVAKANKNDLVIGYRLQRAEGKRRQLVAQMLKVWNRIWLGFPDQIKDIDCAFKLIKRSVLKDISPLTSDGAMISTELLLKASQRGYKIAQVGVHHYRRIIGKPTGNNLKVIARAVKDTFTLKKALYQQKMLLNNRVAVN